MSNPVTEMPSLPRQRAAVRPVSFIPSTNAPTRVSGAALSVLMDSFYRIPDAGRAPRHGPTGLSLIQDVGVHREHAAVDGVVHALGILLAGRGAERDEEREEMLVGRVRAHAVGIAAAVVNQRFDVFFA